LPGDGENLYRYSFNDPVNLIDPSGEVWAYVVAFGVAAFETAVRYGNQAVVLAQRYGRQAVNLVGRGMERLTALLRTQCPLPERGVSPTAQNKLNQLAKQFGTSAEDILQQAERIGRAFRDTNTGNINIFLPRPDNASGFLRVTLDPTADRVISAGLNQAHNVINGIARGRFVPLD